MARFPHPARGRRPWRGAVILLSLVALAACSPAKPKTAAAKPAAPAAAKTAAEPTAIGHPPRPVHAIAEVDLFHGYRCGDTGCLLHQQGYKWGADHRIENPKDCRGKSESVIEGCLAFAGIEGPLGQRGFDASFPN
jgi:hypothetical protein